MFVSLAVEIVLPAVLPERLTKKQTNYLPKLALKVVALKKWFQPVFNRFLTNAFLHFSSEPVPNQFKMGLELVLNRF